jgi:hypothetical protein
MKDELNEQVFIDVKNENDWWVSLGLAEFVSISGFGPFEEEQAFWIAPRRNASGVKIQIPDEDRPVPLLVGTAAGLFKIFHRAAAEGPLVEIVMESAASGGAGKVISDGPSSLGLWHLLIGSDGVPRAEHEVV